MNVRAIIPGTRDNRQVARPPGSLFEILQREVDSVFDDFTRGVSPTDSPAALLPSMDVAETDKEIELTIELPGLEQKDVDISVTNNVLTIRGEKKAEAERQDKNFHLVERTYGTFYRAFQLPNGVDPSAITATMSNGVLKIMIPKPAPAQIKKIEVKSQS
jgi:HSP20 family protein